MTTFKKMPGFDEDIPKEDIQCSATIMPVKGRHAQRTRERYLRDRPHYNPDLCQRMSSVTVDGKPMCKVHAGKTALKIMLKAGETT